MQKFLKWLATSPLATFAKIFLATLLAAAVADWQDAGVIDFADYRTWILAAIIAAIPTIINWLNPQFTLYGRTVKAKPAAKTTAAKRRPASK